MSGHVADIDEIPGLLAISVNNRSLAAPDPVRENRDHPGIRGTGVLTRPEYIEQSQSGCRHAVNNPGDPRMQLTP